MIPLPFELGPGGVLWLMVVTLVASYVRGYSGFGFGAILVTGGALAVNPLYLVAVAILADLVTSAQMWAGVRRAIDWPRAIRLFLGALVGLPLGLWLLTGLPEPAMRAAVSGFVLVLALILLAGWRLPASGSAAVLGTGVVSGAANAAGVGGLPVVVSMAAAGLPPARFRATLVAYFVLLDIWTLPLLGAAGLFDRDSLVAVVLLAPAFVLGTWAGNRRFGRSAPQDFQRLAILGLIGLSVLGLVRAAL